jgi:hypothetical protein
VERCWRGPFGGSCESRNSRKNTKALSCASPSFAPFVFPMAADAQRRIVEYLDGVQVQVAELKCLQAESAAELERLSGVVLARAFQEKL